MKTTEEIYNILKEKFPESLGEMITGQPVEEVITIQPLKIREIGYFLRDNEKLLFENRNITTVRERKRK